MYYCITVHQNTLIRLLMYVIADTQWCYNVGRQRFEIDQRFHSSSHLCTTLVRHWSSANERSSRFSSHWQFVIAITIIICIIAKPSNGIHHPLWGFLEPEAIRKVNSTTVILTQDKTSFHPQVIILPSAAAPRSTAPRLSEVRRQRTWLYSIGPTTRTTRPTSSAQSSCLSNPRLGRCGHRVRYECFL